MPCSPRRSFLLSSSASLLLCSLVDATFAQQAPSATQLPEITVTAPSPIVRRKPIPSRTPVHVARAVPDRNREPAPQPQPTPAVAAPQQGVLPIVTDQFATVTVVPNEEIRRAGAATLGDLLFSKPGITGSEFAPGASSRRAATPSRKNVSDVAGHRAAAASAASSDHAPRSTASTASHSPTSSRTGG